jgi:hypothetical protein
MQIAYQAEAGYIFQFITQPWGNLIIAVILAFGAQKTSLAL